MTGVLVIAYVRRSGWGLLAWMLILGSLPWLLAIATRVGYPTQASLDAFAAESMANLAERAVRGPIFDASLGGIVAWTLSSSGSVIGIVVAGLYTVRYCRADEQAGRLELLLAGRGTRQHQLHAALAVVGSVGVATGAVAAVGLIAVGLPSAGSVLLGLVLAASMLLFTAVAAVCCQLATEPRLAGALTALGVGISFVLSAVADAGFAPVLTWFSPFGWARHAQAFAADRFWVPLIPLTAALGLTAVALRLSRRRDYGVGVIPSRPGRTTAARWVRGPFTLVVRLERGAMSGWAAGGLVLGLLIGAALPGLDAQLAGTAFAEIAARHGTTVGDWFFQFVIYLLAQVAAAAALVTVLGLRSEESNRLAELVLTRPVTRTRWATARWAAALALAAVALAGVGVGAALTSGRSALPATTLAYLPAAAALVGLALALIGWAPRAAVAGAWTVFGLVLAMDLLSEFGLLPAGVVGLISPFAATFTGLITDGPAAAMAVLTILAAAAGTLGVVGLRKRELRLG